ncbi:sensor histidine kinase, partial [Georgenia sp. 10Sc9-8]|nr:sensor histidine kinase [Georgenia halotolerans]
AGLAGALVGAALQAVVTVGASVFPERPAAALPAFLGVGGIVLATWASGLARRARLERLGTLEERARRLELERDQQAQIAAAAERAR